MSDYAADDCASDRGHTSAAAVLFARLPRVRALELAGDAPLVIGFEFLFAAVETQGRFAVAVIRARRGAKAPSRFGGARAQRGKQEKTADGDE
jgi:hypothetical protein